MLGSTTRQGCRAMQSEGLCAQPAGRGAVVPSAVAGIQLKWRQAGLEGRPIPTGPFTISKLPNPSWTAQNNPIFWLWSCIKLWKGR